MRRSELIALGATSLLAASLPRAAAATGGLDPDLGTPPPQIGVPASTNPSVRVLLVSNADPQRLTPLGASDTFSYAGKSYRGGASIVDGPNRRPALVATLPIDAYLYGVVPLEIGRGWPDFALQVQAIVARTYALSHRVNGRNYDLVANTGDQDWGGMEAESPQTNAAVDATEGQVVTYAGGLASVFYSACCGGHTADVSGLWGGVDLPYLRGVADPYCMASCPYASWSATITVGTLLAAAGPKGAALGPLQSIALTPPGSDGRPAVHLLGASGSLDVSAALVRRVAGPGVLRSTLWRTLTVLGDPTQATTALRIEGSGSGHGVGLCQWGARVLAQEGRSPRDIVSFYFPGCSVTDV